MSAANNYQKELGSNLEELFGGEFRFFRSKLELRREREDGYDVIVLSGSNKWSPFINLSFYFGRNFDAARRIEKLLGLYPMHYQIQQYSPNVQHMEGLGYEGEGSWDINIEDPPKDMPQKLKVAIEGIAFPFFERFSTLEAARRALETDDSWCFSPKGPFFHMLFKIDAALDDMDHFREWSKCLESFYLQQAAEDIESYEAKQSEI